MSTSAAAQENREVSDQQLARYTDLIYSKTGVRIPPQKKTLLSNRLRRRLRALDIPDYEAYYKFISSLRATDGEWDQLFQEVTTHETFLFREMVQWDWVLTEFLPELNRAADKASRPKKLRVWSAASSTGDEAYTMAACAADALRECDKWRVEILGTDIGIGVLEEASNPAFNSRRMRDVPERFRRRFFKQRKGEEIWEPTDQLRKLVQFKKHNLMQLLPDTAFDLIFIKNVLIYFDDVSKQTVLDHVTSRLNPGGFLITGRAEGVTQFLHNFERIQPWLHRKPLLKSASK